MAKDPAFLFYSKDWLQGTAGLMPDEKGVYIDLLAHQHQDGDIPNDTKRLARMVGLSQSDFDMIWVNIKNKFRTFGDNRLVNRKLCEITTERSTKAHTKAILSRYAVLIRGLRGYPVNVVEAIKDCFNVVDFEPFEIKEAIIRLNTWFTERLTSALGNANANKDETVTKGKMEDSKGVGGGEEGGREGEWEKMPGKESHNLILPEMKEGSVVELITIATGRRPTQQQIQGLWKIFKVQNFTGTKFYNSENDAYGHFINWSKTQKINGTTNRNGSQSATAGGQDPTLIDKTGFGGI